MKVLWFSHFIPYPPTGGVFQRTFNLIREASKRHTVQLLAFNSHGLPRDSVNQYSKALRVYCESVEVWEMPIPWRRGSRWWMGVTTSPFYAAPYSCRCFWSRELAARWHAVLENRPDLLLHFDSIDLALYSDAARDLPKVLNHHNCESVLALRRGRGERNPLKKAFLLDQARKLARLERDSCPRFDVNVVCSEVDAQMLSDEAATIHTHLVENGVDTEYFQPIPDREEPDTVIFSGMLDWEPNVDGVRHFVQEIWPLVKRDRPGIRLYLAGRNPTPFIWRLRDEDPAIVVVSSPEDMRPWLARASVFICPVLAGGGTRLKILDALAMGKPVVSTSIGCEGLRLKDGDHILIADDPASFAASICRLLNDGLLRKRLAAAGRALVESEYNWSVIGRSLDQAYQCALSRGACQGLSGQPKISDLRISTLG